MKSSTDDTFAYAATTGADGFRDALRAGLAQNPKSIPCKYFYDSDGAKLFDEICTLPEYYLTRTETGLLSRHASEIATLAGSGAEIMEFGAGSGDKIRILLNVLQQPRAYIPVDIAQSWLSVLAHRLRREYPGLRVHPMIGDFAQALNWPFATLARRIGFFPGSTIGNFSPDEARAFLARTAKLLKGGALLVGVDLVKEPAKLHAAYNDPRGLNARFNLNLLARANREAGADFDLSRFFHYAHYNAAAKRIELYLVSARDQVVTAAGTSFQFAEGEPVLTEYSYKYTVRGFQELAESAGFRPAKCWSDDGRLFSLHWLEAA